MNRQTFTTPAASDERQPRERPCLCSRHLAETFRQDARCVVCVLEDES